MWIRSRRINRQTHTFANGTLLCQYCGSMTTGERIRRKLKGGGVRIHTYCRCANNKPGDNHPKVRWKEEGIEQQVLSELEAMKLSTPELADWFGQALEESFTELRNNGISQKRIVIRERTELTQQNGRLLQRYLQGHLDAVTFQDKSTMLQGQMQEVEQALAACSDIDPACGAMAKRVYDFTQDASRV